MVVGLVDPREGDLDGHWAMVPEGARRLKEALKPGGYGSG